MSVDWPETKRRYDQTADIYDARYSEIQRRKYPVLLELLAPNSGDLILDWGCGTGLAIEPLRRLGARVVGMDFSTGMLAHASRRSGAVLLLGDCTRLPLKTGVFDGVLGATVIQNLSRPTQALGEIFRILKPGGRAAISFPKKAAVAIGMRSGLRHTATRECEEDTALRLEKPG